MTHPVGKWTVEYQGRALVPASGGSAGREPHTRLAQARLRVDIWAKSADDAARLCAALHGGSGHRSVGRTA